MSGKEYKYDYTVCNCADEGVFYKQCRSIESNIPNLIMAKLLDDVDGSLVQKYSHPNGMIVVKNDCQVDAVYVQSDFDLLPFF